MQKDKLELFYTRRQFFTAWRERFKANAGRENGKIALSLSDLDQMTDEELSELIPIVIPEARVKVDQLKVFIQYDQDQPIYLFDIESEWALIFNLFNGCTTIQTVAEKLVEDRQWPIEHAFQQAREVFLYLVRRRACRPLHHANSF